MNPKIILSLFTFGFVTVAALAGLFANANTSCEHSNEGLLRMERRILRESDALQIVEPLRCVLEIHKEAEGDLKVYAASTLRTLLGGGQIEGVAADGRYKRVSEALEKLTLDAQNPLHASVVAEFAKGDWDFYKLFCEEGSTDFCVDFMPDGKSAAKEAPLLAAASMLRLKNAYHSLKGEQRQRVAMRIKKLYREVPSARKLQRKFIDQIYHELFLEPSLTQA